MAWVVAYLESDLAPELARALEIERTAVDAALASPEFAEFPERHGLAFGHGADGGGFYLEIGTGDREE
jgi:hypothetical protein